MLGALGSVKLKKAEPISSAPKENKEDSKLDEFVSRIQEVHLESWYAPLQHLTFKSKFIELTVDDAKSFIIGHKFKVGKAKSIPENQEKNLHALEKKIDEAISEWNSRAFVKTSFRSPKDATLSGGRTKDLYMKELDSMKAEGATMDSNLQLLAYMRASGKALEIRSGKEAMDLLLMSERILEDMELALETPDKFNTGLILREWIDIPLEMEFRGFIYKKKFTALSQYFHPVYFPNLPPQKETVEKRIHQFFEDEIKGKLTVESCIIDFAIVDEKRVMLIELNPFNDYEGCGTDPCMFDWKKDQQIVRGDLPFEFKIRTSPRDDVDTLLKDCLKNLNITS